MRELALRLAMEWMKIEQEAGIIPKWTDAEWQLIHIANKFYTFLNGDSE